MRIHELMRRKEPARLITVTTRDDIARAVELMLDHGIGGLPVLDHDGTLVGFAAERDLLRALHLDPDTDERMPIQRVMRTPAPVADVDSDIHDAMARMTRERVRHLVITDAGRIVGVLSVGDLVKHRLEQLETETGVLRDYVAAQRAARSGPE